MSTDPPRIGRPPSIDTEKIDRIVAAIVEGIATGDPLEAAVRVALRKARVPHSTYYDWRKQAAEGIEPYATLVDRVESVRDKLRRKLSASMLDIADHGTKDDAQRFVATKYALERLFPEDYEPAQRIELTGKDGGALETTTVARVVVLPELDDAG